MSNKKLPMLSVIQQKSATNRIVYMAKIQKKENIIPFINIFSS